MNCINILFTKKFGESIFFDQGIFTNNELSNYHCVLSQKSFVNKLSNKLHVVLDFNKYGLWCK